MSSLRLRKAIFKVPASASKLLEIGSDGNGDENIFLNPLFGGEDRDGTSGPRLHDIICSARIAKYFHFQRSLSDVLHKTLSGVLD